MIVLLTCARYCKNARTLRLFRTLRTPLFAILWLVAALSAPRNSHAQSVHFSPAERHLIELIDARASADSLTPFLGDANEKVAWRAAVGLANLGDPKSRPALIAALRAEKRESVWNAEGFALGILGPDSAAFQAVAERGMPHPSRELWEAIGRVVPLNRLASIPKMAQKSLERHAVPPAEIGDMLIQIALRKLGSEEIMAAVDELALNDDPEGRWRAAYVYSRSDDSTRLSQRIGELTQLLSDLGMPEIRMFAATALGHVHNEAAENELLKAARAETEWRVEVNIMNALGAMPRLDSELAQSFERVVDISTKDPLTISPAICALNSIDRMVRLGKLHSSQDTAALKEWLVSYAPRFELHSEVPLRVRAMTLPILARFGTSDLMSEISDFNNYSDVYVRENCLLAAECLEDPAIFSQVLASVSKFESSPLQQYFRLETLDTLWSRAKEHPKFMQALEAMKYANAYRHMIIRISDLVSEPEVVVTALSQLEDSTIVPDKEFRAEAEYYVLGYLNRYSDVNSHDQLLAAIDAAKWLKPKQDSIPKALDKIYVNANASGQFDIRDSAANAMRAIGYAFQPAPPVEPKREPIDWVLLESSPDTLLINGLRGTTFVYLCKYDAPLTCLNMIKLANSGYFSNSMYHRVVPNFVVQSGDKTMSGFGSPGYAIRTEISPLEFSEAGRIGMASGGKDTEGSQWFITHLPTPHLDGKYTIFGIVTRGMDFINETQLGDGIETMLLLKYRPSEK